LSVSSFVLSAIEIARHDGRNFANRQESGWVSDLVDLTHPPSENAEIV
jgi:hypothetical protein